jgi:hypothetical protein
MVGRQKNSLSTRVQSFSQDFNCFGILLRSNQQRSQPARPRNQSAKAAMQSRHDAAILKMNEEELLKLCYIEKLIAERVDRSKPPRKSSGNDYLDDRRFLFASFVFWCQDSLPSYVCVSISIF